MNVYIYVLVDPRDNRIRYVGKTNDVKMRMYKHLFEAKNDKIKHKNVWITGIIQSGYNAPILNVIEECSEEVWQERERFWIKHYRDLGCDLTNLTDGGDGAQGLTHEIRMKIGKQNSKKFRGEGNPMWGRKHTEETKKKFRLRRTGNNFGHFGENHWRYGKPRTESSKIKQSESVTGRKKMKSLSNYIGVSSHKNRWRARIVQKGREHYMGVFPTEIEAAKVYDYYVLSHNIPSKLNFGCDL